MFRSETKFKDGASIHPAERRDDQVQLPDEADGDNWLMWLQEYDYEIQHVPGKTQVVADGLSRLPHWRVHEPISEDPIHLSRYDSDNRDPNVVCVEDNWMLHSFD